ncbi:unnamed protein product [Diamesa tonsa]
MRLLLVTFQAPVVPSIQWNKSWGVNQQVPTQTASVASAPELNAGVSSYSAPAASYSTQFAPIFPVHFHWNKSWGVNQQAPTQVASAPAPPAPVESYSRPIVYKQVTFNQPPPQIENKINTESAPPVSYSRQVPAFNWNFNKYWGVNPAPAVAHQSTANVEVKPVTFTIPSISIPIPSLNWNFNKHWGTNQVQGIQHKTNIEEEEVPIKSPKPAAETFDKTVEAQNVYKPVVASKQIDVNLSLG